MKHSLLLIIVILAISTFRVNGQLTITIDPVPVEQTFSADLSDDLLEFKVKATVANVSDEEISLKWERNILEKPEAWRTKVCDNNICYTPQVSSNIDPNIGLNAPAILGSGESFDLLFYVVPNGAPGSGSFEVAFSLVSNPDEILETAVFHVTVESLTSTREEGKASLRLFPNPSTDYIELTGNNRLVDHLVVYNLIGRQVRSYRVVEGGKYNVADLPTGMYLVSLINDRDGVIKTLRLSKRTIRP